MASRVLVIAPHPDDEAIGCGGMICAHRRASDSVHVVFMTSGERGIEGRPADEVRTIREAEAAAAAKVLDLTGVDFLRLADQGLAGSVELAASRLRSVIEKVKPRYIYLPHTGENHPDHAAILPIVSAALKGMKDGVELRGYEVWTPMAEYTWPEDVTRYMSDKLRAVRCYRSQLAVFRYDRAVRGLNQYRGSLAARCGYAEVFKHYDL